MMIFKITKGKIFLNAGVYIFQKTRNYSVRERNETYKISKLFRSFEKKIGIIPTTFVLI